MDLASTIAALSTPPGRSAIGVVRLSGAHALPIVRQMVRFAPTALPRHAYLGQFVDQDGSTVDEVVVTWFPQPRSYTGEDVVEISCHGAPVILHFCLERAVYLGARLAEPGEFTLRALYNGRLDLPGAEAVRDLIDSTTLYQARVATQQRQGALSRRLQPLKRQLIDLIALMEAGIDFAEDDVSIAPREEILGRIGALEEGVEHLAGSFRWGRLVREGFSLAIVGEPNVGKSSLFNALLRQDRAIVTPIAGTTRDLVSESIEIEGIPVRVVDTAGLRATEEPIERLGIERTLEAMTDASVTLVVVDASQAANSVPELASGAKIAGYTLFLANKCDLPSAVGPPGFLAVSARTGLGIPELRHAIFHLISSGVNRLEMGFVTSLRQKNLLERCADMLRKAYVAAETQVPHEMILLDLYCSMQPLDEITGATTADDILHRVFSTFCIGK